MLFDMTETSLSTGIRYEGTPVPDETFEPTVTASKMAMG
ncbi:hypothetical protein PITCH_A980036 [uncultured Desulfobacterium sp.]|uniref:Uncharacterized protein n=1 Tax=uncultured Desulfobacterium sp. TaxID=201089 RepID=A0A445N475_9BACT|nr:hypothetical protein PITCH_A980036 [uncultured Desulfobacterium sp.]